MFIPFLALPLVAHWIAVADGVPSWDVTPSCRGAASAGYIEQTKERLKGCLESEQRTHEALNKNWSTFPAVDRIYCVQSLISFEPTYTELATCLEMRRDVKNIGGTKPADAISPSGHPQR